MMQTEGIFTAQSDLIEDFFGNRVIVSRILPETGTFLDHLHFVSTTFRL